jgi:hypothetical protein
MGAFNAVGHLGPATARHRASSAAVLLLVVFCAAGAHADPLRGTAPLVIDIRDYASVTQAPMERALAQVQGIFTIAGVPTRIALGARNETPTNQPAETPRAVIVLVYPSVRDDAMVHDRHILGAAPGAATGGRIAYVFASRVEAMAKRYGIAYGTLLGVVLAHEVGHVLLPGRPHAHSGLMRSAPRQMNNLLLERLAFTAEETAAIREAMF